MTEKQNSESRATREREGADSAEVRVFDGDRTDWLFEQLRADILSGAMAPGQKISEPQIARRFNMSRAPIREALRRLEERRLAVRSPRTGARVMVLSPEEIADLVMMREHLDGLAANLAAKNMTDDEVIRLRDITVGRTRDLQSSENPSYTDPGRDFHTAIARGSKSAELERLLSKDYFFRFRLLHQQRGWTPQIGLMGQVEHMQVLEAIEARDAPLAELLMKRHVRVAMARYVDAAKSNQSASPE